MMLGAQMSSVAHWITKNLCGDMPIMSNRLKKLIGFAFGLTFISLNDFRRT
jgi:hypothetical protein